MPRSTVTTTIATDKAIRGKAASLLRRIEARLADMNQQDRNKGVERRLLVEARDLLRLATDSNHKAVTKAAEEFSQSLLYEHVRVALGHHTPAEAMSTLEDIHADLFGGHAE